MKQRRKKFIFQATDKQAVWLELQFCHLYPITGHRTADASNGMQKELLFLTHCGCGGYYTHMNRDHGSTWNKQKKKTSQTMTDTSIFMLSFNYQTQEEFQTSNKHAVIYHQSFPIKPVNMVFRILSPFSPERTTQSFCTWEVQHPILWSWDTPLLFTCAI